jgi:hypothetical protein
VVKPCPALALADGPSGARLVETARKSVPTTGV